MNITFVKHSKRATDSRRVTVINEIFRFGSDIKTPILTIAWKIMQSVHAEQESKTFSNEPTTIMSHLVKFPIGTTGRFFLPFIFLKS